MSYHIYTTSGIVLKRVGVGEANILLYVLTEDLGLIFASAQSARLTSSKLRSTLQEFSYISISCVKGKNGWKVMNVIEKENFFFGLPDHTHRVLAQVCSVLLKMMQGESPHPEIFQTVHTGFQFLKSVPEKDISYFEYLIILRIFYHLGYVAKDSRTEVFLTDTNIWQENLLEQISVKKEVVVTAINNALKMSHL